MLSAGARPTHFWANGEMQFMLLTKQIALSCLVSQLFGLDVTRVNQKRV